MTKNLKKTTDNLPSDAVENQENLNLDAQTRDLIDQVRQRRKAAHGKDIFYIPEKDKKSGYAYQWASTDRQASPSKDILEEDGWREVPGYRHIKTEGYDVNGNPGKHVLMCLQKAVHDELLKIQNEINQAKKEAVYGKEVTFKDGGKNRMGSKVEKDNDADFLN